MAASGRGAASLPGPNRQRRAGRALAFVLALPAGLAALLVMVQLDSDRGWLSVVLIYAAAVGVVTVLVLTVLGVGKRLSPSGRFGLLDTSATILLIVGAIPALILLMLAGTEEVELATVLFIPIFAGPFFLASGAVYALARRQRLTVENDRETSATR